MLIQTQLIICVFHHNEGVRRKKPARDGARKATEEKHCPR